MTLKVAIVGRPNVGKSTLFNRLAGRKLAIVDDQPGVTRDRREARGRLGDIDLDLIDTAGFEDVSDESLQARMRAQTERALEDCDLCLFVIDAREGVTPLDRIFADIVRRRDRPVVLLANKAEGRAGDLGASEAFALGLGDPIEISAEHGEGLGEIFEAVSAYAAIAEAREAEAEAAEEGADRPIRIAVIGRPNAGKSTLINRLIGEDRLLTGPEAGITRDAIAVDFEADGRRLRLIDTAGLRRRARVQDGLEKLSTADTIRAITFAEVVVLVMDCENAFETQDLQIADLVEREGRALVYCLAKWDLVSEPHQRLVELRKRAETALPQLRGAPLVPLSAETGFGLKRLLPAVLEAYGHWSTKVKTRDLNDWLAMAVERHPPPAVNGRRIKPKYMAQLKGRPPTFVLFASRAEHLPEQYKRYLVNSLRDSFELPGVPIRVTIKSSRNPYVDGDAPPERRSPSFGATSAGGSRPAEKPARAGSARGKSVSDPTISDMSTSGPAIPEMTAPEKAAPGKSARGTSAQGKSASGKSASGKAASGKAPAPKKRGPRISKPPVKDTKSARRKAASQGSRKPSRGPGRSGGPRR